jgi:cytochrome c6
MKKRTAILTILALSTLLIVPSLLADGAATFKAKCAMCHGADGAGQTTMGKNMKLRDLGSAAVQAQTDAQLKAWVADGKGKMPAYKTKLSAAEIDALVAFMRTLKK